jgi:predicted GIY-YIG superfamily endonuclease
MGIIYKITSPSNKVYIGQTIHTLEERIKGHKKKSTNCTLLKRAIDKYGIKMVYEVVETIPDELLDEREIYWIKYYNSLAPNGYNCSTGGNNKKELSDLLKDNISKGLRNNKINRDGYIGYIHKT